MHKLSDLLEATQIGTVKFSDLTYFDNWAPQFALSIDSFFDEIKEKGLPKMTEELVAEIKKMGKQNYNALTTNYEAYGITSIPTFEAILDTDFWLNSSSKALLQKAKVLALLSMIRENKKLTAARIQKEIEDLQIRLMRLESDDYETTIDDFKDSLCDFVIDRVQEVLKKNKSKQIRKFGRRLESYDGKRYETLFSIEVDDDGIIQIAYNNKTISVDCKTENEILEEIAEFGKEHDLTILTKLPAIFKF